MHAYTHVTCIASDENHGVLSLDQWVAALYVSRCISGNDISIMHFTSTQAQIHGEVGVTTANICEKRVPVPLAEYMYFG